MSRSPPRPDSEAHISTLAARLRRALAPRYELDDQLGAGGMSLVFRARDPRLGRTVAIKVLRPELATARGAERFLREASLLARLSHPNVVPIHDMGEADGLFYYVMDCHEGASLADALAAGPLSEERADALAGDLLAGLQAVHEAGIVHRDVKPSNIFRAGDRALLADFGIARALDGSGEPLTEAGGVLGTPGYMSPEQAAGEPVSVRSDLYSAAAVLYRAWAGRRWRVGEAPAEASWEGIPRSLRPVLARALEPDPASRWPDAASFRRALLERRAAAPGRRGLAVALLAAATAGLFLLVRSLGPETDLPEPVLTYDVALLPCETVPPSDSVIGQNLTRLVTHDLQMAPELEVVRQATTDRWWRSAQEAGTPDGAVAAAALGARVSARCRVTVAGDSLSADLRLERPEGSPIFLPPIRAPTEDPPLGAADRVVVGILRSVPGIPHVSTDVLGSLADHPAAAVIPFLWGERAFARNARVEAERHYSEAVAADSSLAIAQWRLADVRRWLSKPPGIDLTHLYRAHGNELSTLDRLLLEARLEPSGPPQWDAYQAILERYPRDAYVTLIYGDELMHRGPLWGVELDSAAAVLHLATRRDSLLAPAYEHLVLVAIRLGERPLAESALRRLETIAALDAASRGDLLPPALLRQAFLERFEPEVASERRNATLTALDGGSPRRLYELLRFVGPYLDLPATQIELARRLREGVEPEPEHRISSHLAEGVALMVGGRCREALAHFDSATALEASVEARVDLAAWRTLPSLLGFPCGGSGDAEEGARVLGRIAAGAALPVAPRRRAATLLGLGAAPAGGAEEARRWMDALGRIPSGPSPTRADALLAAEGLARAGRLTDALQRSRPLLERDSAALLARPFERALLYGRRARWQEELGRWEEASDSWLWHANSDLIGIPGSRVQAGDVDWALSAFARLERAKAAQRAGRTEDACRLVGAVLRVWRDPDPELREAVARAEGIAAESCS